ncbi:MAG TPA: Gp138 family membrane-puncturing spike protein [candidate division Zixibacteria bacterium]|nr:Gp138 family membrane-puncturing spike protein [candidate division Zixibacteria bacterium]
MADVDEPEIEDILDDAIESAIAVLETSFPAVVTSYAEGRASVQPVTRDRYIDPDTGEESFRLGSVITNVPFGRQATATHGLTFPLQRGDLVYCSCAARSVDEVLTTGETDNTPGHPRMHDRTDAVIVAVIHPFGTPLPESNRNASGTTVFGPTVFLGDGTASDFVALASLVSSELSALWSALNTHIHVTTATVGAGPAVGVISPPGVLGSPGSVAATKVKAK